MSAYRGFRLYGEDLVAGQVFEFGRAVVKAEDLGEFAERWAPPIGAATGALESDSVSFGGGLVLFGIFQRLAVRDLYRELAIVAGSEIFDVEFAGYVEAGEAVSGMLVVESVVARTPGRSQMTWNGELFVTERRAVLRLSGTVIVAKRCR